MTAQEIVDQIRPLGSEGYKRVLMNHGIQEPVFGVKIEELKKFQKQIKRDYQLSLDLYATGIYDAMYLAGLIADDPQMTEADLDAWVSGASCPSLLEYTVPWVASESKLGWEIGLKWIDSPDVKAQSAGWSTLGCIAMMKPDSELDIDRLRILLHRIKNAIHSQPGQVKGVMNFFVIAVGSYVVPLADEALHIAEEIGKVEIVLPGSCKVAFAPDYIRKTRERGSLGKKRKTCKC